jgi:hypothetical protein
MRDEDERAEWMSQFLRIAGRTHSQLHRARAFTVLLFPTSDDCEFKRTTVPRLINMSAYKGLLIVETLHLGY